MGFSFFAVLTFFGWFSIFMFCAVKLLCAVVYLNIRQFIGDKNGFKAKENNHFKKIEALNQAATDLRKGNFAAFEEFTSYEDSDYDSSDCEQEPPKVKKPLQEKILDSNGKPVKKPPPVVPQKPPPKSDKNHEVKPKDSFKRFQNHNDCMNLEKLLKPGKKPPSEIPENQKDCEKDFLQLLAIDDNYEVSGKLIDALEDPCKTCVLTPKEAV